MKRPPKERVDLRCPEPACGELMVLRYAKNFDNWFYGCVTFPDCRSSHGAHPSGEPLGIPATNEVKRARIDAHESFDRLWKGGEMKRGGAYRWMRKAMGLTRKEAHIGRFDEYQCDRLIGLVEAHLGECSACEGRAHQDGCTSLEPAWDLGDLLGRSCQGCCPHGCSPSGMQRLADATAAKLRGILG